MANPKPRHHGDDNAACISARRIGRPSAMEATALSKSIIDAALQEFRERGFAGASIERIALAANVTRAAIYRRYADKQALFSSVADQQIGILQLLADKIRCSVRDPLAALSETTRAVLHHLLSPPALDLQRIVIAEAASFPLLARRLAAPRPIDVSNRLDNLIAAAQASGQLAPAPPALWRDIMLRLVSDGARWEALVDPGPWTEARIDAEFDRMWPSFIALASAPSAITAAALAD